MKNKMPRKRNGNKFLQAVKFERVILRRIERNFNIYNEKPQAFYRDGTHKAANIAE